MFGQSLEGSHLHSYLDNSSSFKLKHRIGPGWNSLPRAPIGNQEPFSSILLTNRNSILCHAGWVLIKCTSIANHVNSDISCYCFCNIHTFLLCIYYRRVFPRMLNQNKRWTKLIINSIAVLYLELLRQSRLHSIHLAFVNKIITTNLLQKYIMMHFPKTIIVVQQNAICFGKHSSLFELRE